LFEKWNKHVCKYANYPKELIQKRMNMKESYVENSLILKKAVEKQILISSWKDMDRK